MSIPAHRNPLRRVAPAKSYEAEAESSSSSSDSEDDESAAVLAAVMAAAEPPRASPSDVDSWKRAAPGDGPPRAAWSDSSGGALTSSGNFRGNELVGATVSVLDITGQRANAKVVTYAGEGNYMVRTEAMQFPMELDLAIRRRDAWIVAKAPAK